MKRSVYKAGKIAITTFVVIFFIAFTSSYVFGQGKSNGKGDSAKDGSREVPGFMNSEVSLNIKKVSLRVILDKLESQAEVYFSYRDKLLNKEYLYSAQFKNVTLDKALEIILSEEEIDFVPLPGGYIVLRERKKKNVRRGPSVISGQVIDRKTGRKLADASVKVVQRAKGTSTGAEGHYLIPGLKEGKYILVASYLGYEDMRKQVTISAAADTVMVNFLMTPTSLVMDELIVIGYDTESRAELTGSVASIQMDKATSSSHGTVQQAIQGRVSGVQVVQTGGGKPGGSFNVNIRGIGTINSESPLYVIDGVPIQGRSSSQTGIGILNGLNPNDIESINILKDASSAAIYGSRASGGVVLITTKKGTEGNSVEANFESLYGTQVQTERYNVLNAEQYTSYLRDVHSDPSISSLPGNFRNGQRPPYNTDWQDVLFRPAPMQNYNLDISGGGKDSRYSVGLGYYDRKGTLVGSEFQRYSLRLNSRFNASENISIGGSILLSKSDISQNDQSGGRRSIEHAVKQAPTVPVYDDSFVGGFGWPVTADGQDAGNPVATAHLIDNTTKRYSVISSAYGKINFLQHFSYKLQAGLDLRYEDSGTYNDYYQTTRKLDVFSSLNRTRGQNFNPLVEQTLTYDQEFGKHVVNALAGFSAQSFTSDFVNATGQQMPRDVRSLNAATTHISVDSGVQESSLRSIFGRVSYSYDNKYLFSGNIRRDESSKLFNAVDPVGVFPSISVGWRVSNEEFFRDFNLISNLKLRAGWGELGNQSVLGNYPTTTNLNSDYFYVLGDTEVQGIGQQALANREITWETSVQKDLGIELGLLNDRIFVDFDYYNRTTKDLLWTAQIPESVGLDPPFINAGTVENKGIELAVSYQKMYGELNVSLSSNLTTIRNEVKSLGANDQLEIIEGDIANDVTGVSITRVGDPIGQFYGYVSDGLFQDWDEVYNHATQNQDPAGGRDESTARQYTAPGDIRFKDLNGDGQITSDDRTIIGNPIPDFIYGFTASLAYKNIDLNLFLEGDYGNDILNGATRWLQDFRQNFNQGQAYLDAWTPQHRDTEIHRVAVLDPNSNMSRLSDLYIEDGSYLRVKTLSLGYTFPDDLINRTGADRFRIYATARNLLTLTSYSGLEPEIGSLSTGTARDAGVDRFVYPQAKQFLVGIQLGF